jgi:hypothetical protein
MPIKGRTNLNIESKEYIPKSYFLRDKMFLESYLVEQENMFKGFINYYSEFAKLSPALARRFFI